MRRSLLTLAASSALGLFATADASACCHKKKAVCAEPVACAPAPTCAPAKKKCGLFGGGGGGLCHKKKVACAPAPCETYAAPVAYEAGAAELYAYSQLGPDPLRELIAELGLSTRPMRGGTVILGDRILRDLDDVRRELGEATYRATAAVIEYHAQGTIQVRGKREPVSTWEVVRVRTRRGSVRGIQGLEARMVGRDAPFALLKSLYPRVVQDRELRQALVRLWRLEHRPGTAAFPAAMVVARALCARLAED